MWPTPWFTIGTKPTPDVISGKGSESSELENAGPTDWKKNVWSLTGLYLLSHPHFII